MKRGKKDNLHAKVILLGGTYSGKTSIINSYIHENFVEDCEATFSCNYCRKKIEINNKVIIMDIWDTPGNELYKKFNTFYIKDADAIILVYDITSSSNFKYLQNYWESYIISNIPRNTSKKKIFCYII